MLSNVTWAEYLGAVGVLVVAYYLTIGLKYRKDLTGFIHSLKNRNYNSAEETETIIEDTEDISSMDELEAVVQDLRYAILERAGKTATKQELLEKFQQRLANYSGLRKPAYRVAINNYLIQHSQELCGVVLSEGELERIWNTLLR
ncbi:hypothetical protein [Pedobacter sp. UBA4863]|uniref:hypothetical protein n=1 Tax=Pedobacter sp. UBA4863 TaxID=1947060 RepID=UPI0025DB5730|nr:hypothetical protein [Pedobacter sp. UBA4863]